MKDIIGTLLYTSINSHLGIEQSRRDDLESFGYVVVHLLKGTLPWKGLSGDTNFQKLEKIKQCKLSTTIESLCDGLPQQFISYFKHIRSLQFNEKPDYKYLRSLFYDIYTQKYQ